MTIEDIFSEIATHMVKGLMIHDQLAQMFCFLGLPGYQKIQSEQYIDESTNYTQITHYYIATYDRVLKTGRVDNPDLLSSITDLSKDQLRSTTRKQLIESGFTSWVKWEKDTKDLYQRLYSELIACGEVSSAAKLLDYIKDVDSELAKAKDILHRLRAVEFDLVAIADEQSSVYEQFTSL